MLPAMAMKHGYATVDEYKAGVQRKFSLLETGVIHRPSTRLLLINVSLSPFPIRIRGGKHWERCGKGLAADSPRVPSTA